MHVYICPLSQYKFGPVYANYFFMGLVNCGSQSLLMYVCVLYRQLSVDWGNAALAWLRSLELYFGFNWCFQLAFGLDSWDFVMVDDIMIGLLLEKISCHLLGKEPTRYYCTMPMNFCACWIKQLGAIVNHAHAMPKGRTCTKWNLCTFRPYVIQCGCLFIWLASQAWTNP